MARAVVTGAAGFIGSHLVTRLLRGGYEVWMVDNLSTGRKENIAAALAEAPPGAKTKFFEIDLTECGTGVCGTGFPAGQTHQDVGSAVRTTSDLTSICEGADYVFHLAALADIVPSISDPLTYHRANVEGTVRLLEAVRAANGEAKGPSQDGSADGLDRLESRSHNDSGIDRSHKGSGITQPHRGSGITRSHKGLGIGRSNRGSGIGRPHRGSGTRCKVIYAASSSCYGIPDEFPTPETADIRPQYPYALTKYVAERYVLHWGQVYSLPVVSLRFFNIYGPRSRTGGTYGAVFGVFLAQKLVGEALTVVGDGTQTRDFVYVTDVVEACVRAAESDLSGEVLNVGAGNPQSVNRLCELIGGPKVHMPKRPGEPDCTWADISRIRRLLDWAPAVPFEEGVARMLETIESWREAPVWTPETIADATRDWFTHLGKPDVCHA